MKRRRLMVSFLLALSIVLSAAGARAASLDTVKTLIEQTALPMAREIDAQEMNAASYSPEQLAALMAAAREAGVTPDDHAYAMRALRRGESYPAYEAVKAICQAAFGGPTSEWTVEARAWYDQMLIDAFGFEPFNQDLPDADDLPAADAYRIAQEALGQAYEGAKDLSDPILYKRLEHFSALEEDELGRAGRIWYLTYFPLDLTHAEYEAAVNTLGEVTSVSEKPQDWSSFTVSQLEKGIRLHCPPRSDGKSVWGAETWHTFRDMLPDAQRDSSWSEQYDAYLSSVYPLPDEADIPGGDALAIALKDAGMKDSEYTDYIRVLLADEEGRRIWKITLIVSDNIFALSDGTRSSWEIDAKTGEILSRCAWDQGDREWRGYVLDSTYRAATEGMLTGEEAVMIAADALRKHLGEDDIPYTDPSCFTVSVRYDEASRRWGVVFSPNDLAWGRGEVRINEADREASVVSAYPSQVDGDSLWTRYMQVYGGSRWRQETWVQFGKDMQRYQPKEWVGRLLKATEYPEESTVGMTWEEAARIAFACNAQKTGEVLDATLIAAQPHPAWKIVLPDDAELKLYEIDAETGEVLDIEKYRADDYDFDHPVKRHTLHRVFAPVYVETFGPERLAAQEICKAFGDLDGDCVFDLFRVRLREISGEGETAYHKIETAGYTVTFRAKRPGEPSYRVEFDENWMTVSVEKIEQ